MRLMPKQNAIRCKEISLACLLSISAHLTDLSLAPLVSGYAPSSNIRVEEPLAASKQASALAFNLARNESRRLDWANSLCRATLHAEGRWGNFPQFTSLRVFFKLPKAYKLCHLLWQHCFVQTQNVFLRGEALYADMGHSARVRLDSSGSLYASSITA